MILIQKNIWYRGDVSLFEKEYLGGARYELNGAANIGASVGATFFHSMKPDNYGNYIWGLGFSVGVGIPTLINCNFNVDATKTWDDYEIW